MADSHVWLREAAVKLIEGEFGDARPMSNIISN